MWHEHQAANPGMPGDLAIRDAEIADETQIDLSTVRAFLVSEDGRGIVVKTNGGELSVSTVEAGYGE